MHACMLYNVVEYLSKYMCMQTCINTIFATKGAEILKD